MLLQNDPKVRFYNNLFVSDTDGAVPTVTETTILTYSPSGVDAYISEILVSGEVDGVWRVKVEGTTQSTVWTTIAKTSQSIKFADGVLAVADGETLTVTITHSESSSKAFSAQASGYTV